MTEQRLVGAYYLALAGACVDESCAQIGSKLARKLESGGEFDNIRSCGLVEAASGSCGADLLCLFAH